LRQIDRRRRRVANPLHSDMHRLYRQPSCTDLPITRHSDLSSLIRSPIRSCIGRTLMGGSGAGADG